MNVINFEGMFEVFGLMKGLLLRVLQYLRNKEN
jgi:hypothetical protein